MKKLLHFTQEQFTNILQLIADEKEGFNKLLKIALEALMLAERKEHNRQTGDVGNGFRLRRIYGKGKEIVLSVPRSRFLRFYPLILAVMKEEDEEARNLAFALYSSGLTTSEAAKIFKQVYGREYSTSQLSRMFDYARNKVRQWLNRPLESYYPIIYIDAVFIAVRRGDSVIKEAFYTILGVRSDRTREVLAIVNKPTESAEGWRQIFEELRSRGVEKIDLVVSDALKGIEDAVAAVYPGISHQFCVTHLKRNVLKQVRPKDKSEIAEDLEEVFNPDNPSDTPDTAWKRWEIFVEKHGKKYPRLKRMLDIRYRFYFTYFKYDYRVRRMLYTTNWIERLNRDYRRVTRMRGALPNVEAALLLLGNVAMEKTAYERKIPRLYYETSFQWTE